ncbi:Retrovirus-related Pol polyprotein from transposon RE1 [Vitis vinifera]|uniref:Retrovirus-related Pol polyprotein from transposon RE1 n=1 Tax=Vitis vinifera TaxID=29760 RepID=A0A438IJ74_VITVI|nr:Retrovirus-related Pol polyprotein from transposon RE1 [Vitis vinifera]
MIISEKLVGSENYLSWSAPVELWFMGQGYEDHLVTQEADIPKVNRVQWRKIDAQLCSVLWQSVDPKILLHLQAYKTCFKFWNQAKGLYTNDIQRLYKIASVRLLLSMAAMRSWLLYQLDIKNVFLHGDFAEEVYMKQPPGFLAQGESSLVCRLRHSLYGLKQSPRVWFSRFSSVVQEFDMFCNTIDHSVFYHHNSSEQCIYLVVYVDDIVITDSDQNGIRKLKQYLFTHFQTKDLGKLKYFLGIEIAQSSSDVVLSQRKYALDILGETGMLDCKPVDTPMDPNVKLIPGQGEPLRDPGRY